MASPADLQALVNALPWTNGIELLDGAEMEALWNECIAVFESDGGEVWPTVGAPASGLGNNGDYAIDQTNKFIYGPKAAGAWPAGTSFGGGGSGGLLAANNLSDVASKPTSFNNLSPMTTAGDIIYGGASGAAQRLAAGTALQVLFGGTVPSWGTPPSASGLAEVATISALQGLATSTGTVLLTAALRFGLFTWNSANLATAVTNDPGQGMWVAPASDTTGASGAWVRQTAGRFSIGWWGAVGDALFNAPFPPVPWATATVSNSPTDNGPALANFGVFARYWCMTLGLSLSMYTPPPTGQGYVFNGQNCVYWLFGLTDLDWDNGGVYWQNIYSGTTSTYGEPWSVTVTPLQLTQVSTSRLVFQWLINQTTVGAYGFSMTPNNGSNLIPAGSLIVNNSYDIFTAGTTSWTSIGAANNTVGTRFTATGAGSGTGVAVIDLAWAGGLFNAATSLINGYSYTIYSPGNTSWTSLGAANNNAGTSFIANGPGSGTGIATPVALYPGRMCVLTSLDTFGAGYPPDPQQQDFLTIFAINAFAAASVSTATLASATGLLTLTFATAPFGATIGSALNGIAVPVSGITGTGGGVAALNATWPIKSINTPGTTVILQVTPGLTASALSGGAVGPVAIVQTEQAIQNTHLPTFPDAQYFGSIYACGAARVWGLTTGPWAILDGGGNTHNYPLIPFEIRHKWTNLFVGVPSWNATSSAEVVWTIGGQRLILNGYTGVGLSESVCYEVVNENATILNVGETDKLNSSLTYRGLRYKNALGISSGQMTFQSPADFVLQEDCSVPSIATGNVKHWKSVNCDYNALSIFAGNLGFSVSQIFDNCKIGFWPQGTLVDGSDVLTIDGTNVAFGTAGLGPGSAAGVITILRSYTNTTLGLEAWATVPGATVCLAGPSGLYTGSTLNAVSGDGVVLSLSQDPTYVYIQTTLPFATLPAWANGNIFMFRNQGADFLPGCDGCDTVRQAVLAYRKGLKYWEYKKFIIGGSSATVLIYINTLYGNLTQVVVTPKQIGSAPGAFATLSFNTYNSGSNFAADSGGMAIKIIVGVAGQRVITQGAFVGNQTGDTVTVGGSVVTSTGLPTGRVLAGINGVESLQINLTGVTVGPTTSPMFEVELYLEGGYCRKVFPVNYDGGGVTLAFATIGQLPP